MSTPLYALHTVRAPDEELQARATTEKLPVVEEPAEAEAAPEFNEVIVSPVPHAGLSTHQVASQWNEPEQYVPGWSGNANVTPSFARINEPQASAGTAAGREMAGAFGHGTVAFAQGIEPVIRPGAVFGGSYFAVNGDPTDRQDGVQRGMGSYMEQAPGYDRAVTGNNAASAILAAHAAADAGSESWYGAMLPGVIHG
jgi:hypothetical protein